LKRRGSKTFIHMLLLTGTLSAFPALADSDMQYSFADVWKTVREHSPDIKGANHEFESAHIFEARTSRHWYPRIFAEGRAFSTNDPALTFMSQLGQRQINASDFAPQTLNQPGSNFFEHGALGIDFPIYEGGSKTAEAEASSLMAKAKALEAESAEVTQYAEVAKTYSAILSLQRQRQELQSLAQDVDATLSHYKIGTKSNPVGYSGLLGLKNLRNRIQGLLLENSSKISSFQEQIRIVAEDLPENWTPRPENALTFIKTNLSPKKVDNQPVQVRASRLAAEALDKAKVAERARFLPKLGLFGTEDLYAGDRGSPTSYTAGAYLQWDLFSAGNYGAVDQAAHTAAAAQARADGLSERAHIEKVGARAESVTLEKNLLLLEDSAKLLEEQTRVARNLFQNGSINALQFIEVLSRRVDLIINRTDAEHGLAQANAILVVQAGAEGNP
jgi:outer membrane protein TolC